MAQTYQDKPTLAAWNALGAWEKIAETETTTASRIYTYTFPEMDWSEWQYVAFLFDLENYTSDDSSLYITVAPVVRTAPPTRRSPEAR